jgi:hypothetical protein
MGSKISFARKIVATAVVGGALVLGTVGTAGASAPTLTATSGPSATTTQLTPAAKNRLAHLSCTRATKVLTRIQKTEAGIAAGLPKMHSTEAKAAAAGKTRMASGIGKMITRLGRPGATAQLQRLAMAIEAKCNVSAPAIVPTTAPGRSTGPDLPSRHSAG